MDDVEHLCALLAEETRVCDLLAGVLRDEQRAVVDFDADAMLACVERGDTVRRVLVDLTGQRRALVGRLLATQGASGGVVDLVARLPLPARPVVDVALGRLRVSARALRGLERQTARLVDASIAHVGELVRALTAQQPGARYGADAVLTAPAAAERLTRRA